MQRGEALAPDLSLPKGCPSDTNFSPFLARNGGQGDGCKGFSTSCLRTMTARVGDTDGWQVGTEQRPGEVVTRQKPDPNAAEGKETAQNGTTVVKIGGSTLGKHDTTLEDLVALQGRGVRPVVVHGGGKVISEWMVRQGVRPRFVRGLRVTDAPSMDIAVAVLTGLVNKSIVASILAMGGKAVGLSGVDGGLLQARIEDPELGLVGTVVEVNTGPITTLIDAGYIPVISPISVHKSSGQVPPDAPLLNVNADTAAGEIAGSIVAQRLVLMTDVDGVLDSSRRRIPRLTERQAIGLMRSNVVDGGMIPKIGACLRALKEVDSAHIIDGRRSHALMESLTGVPVGTRVG